MQQTDSELDFDQRREDLSALMRRGEVLLSEIDGNAAKRLRSERARLEAGRLFVVVVGEFKRGKSSLMNALLRDPTLFPVDVDIATNLVSTIAFGAEEKITVHLGDPENRRSISIERAQIADYATEQGNPGNREGARLLAIETPNQKLRGGLVLVDTPGVGSVYTDHSAITYGFMTNANIVLLVIDALSTISARELAFMEGIASSCEALIVVVTKIDQVADPEAIVANTRVKLQSVFKASADDLPVIPVSNFALFEYLRSGDSEDLEMSNLPALDDALWGILGTRAGAILLLRGVAELTRTLDLSLAPFRAELNSYESGSSADSRELQEELDVEVQRLTAVSAGQAEWRRRLGRLLGDLRFDTQEGLQVGFTSVRRRFEESLNDNESDPSAILGRVEGDVALLWSQTQEGLEERVKEVCRELVELTALELAVEFRGLDGASVLPSLLSTGTDGPLPSSPQILGWKAVEVGRGALGGATVGAIVGTLVAPGIGTMLGLFLGAQGARVTLAQMSERESQRRSGEIRRCVAPFLADSQQQLLGQLARQLRDIEFAIGDELEERIRDEIEVRKRTADQLREARGRSEKEIERRVAEIKAPLESANELLTEASVIAAREPALALPRDSAPGEE